MKIYYLLISVFLFSFFSCDSDDFTLNERTIIVDSELVMPIEDTSAKEWPYYSIKYKETEDKPENWFLVLDITNFDYKEGYTYIIKVEEKVIKDPLPDQPTTSYKFLELISKIEDTEIPG